MIQVGELYINLDLITFISTSEYNPHNAITDEMSGFYSDRSRYRVTGNARSTKSTGAGRIMVRFSGDATNHVALMADDAANFLDILESFQMSWIKLSDKWVNPALVTLVSTSEYRKAGGGRITVRFAGETANHIILTGSDATTFLKNLPQNESP